MKKKCTSLEDLPGSDLSLCWSLQFPAADLMRTFKMPREGRQGHPAESSIKDLCPSLQGCSAPAHSLCSPGCDAAARALSLCWAHPAPPWEQLWHLQFGFVHDHSSQPPCAPVQLCSLGCFWVFCAMMSWSHTSHNAKSTKMLGVSMSCFSPPAGPCLWWVVAPLEEEEAELQKQLLKTEMTWWERRKLSLVCNEYLDCLIISFLGKNTSESNFLLGCEFCDDHGESNLYPHFFFF